jgi:hypothetical protein
MPATIPKPTALACPWCGADVGQISDSYLWYACGSSAWITGEHSMQSERCLRSGTAIERQRSAKHEEKTTCSVNTESAKC